MRSEAKRLRGPVMQGYAGTTRAPNAFEEVSALAVLRRVFDNIPFSSHSEYQRVPDYFITSAVPLRSRRLIEDVVSSHMEQRNL
jgi:hypothetical protein